MRSSLPAAQQVCAHAGFFLIEVCSVRSASLTICRPQAPAAHQPLHCHCPYIPIFRRDPSSFQGAPPLLSCIPQSMAMSKFLPRCTRVSDNTYQHCHSTEMIVRLPPSSRMAPHRPRGAHKCQGTPGLPPVAVATGMCMSRCGQDSGAPGCQSSGHPDRSTLSRPQGSPYPRRLCVLQCKRDGPVGSWIFCIP